MKITGNVYLTRLLPQTVMELLQTHCRVEVNPEDRTISQKELLRKVRGRDAVLCMLADTIDTAVMDAAAGVKIFANYAVGYNNIDIRAARERGIWVTNTPGVLTQATADLAWALLFAVARRVVESDRYTRQGRFQGWAPLLLLGQEITGRTLGIIGSGRIGTAFGRKARGFDMKILYSSRRRNPEFETETGAVFTKLEQLLQESDFVSLHLPLSAETRYLIGRRELQMMKPNAILINTARGPIVDETALVEALREKWIFGAGFDVYENEPQLTPGLTELDNVVILPHIGSGTGETRLKMGFMAVENILAVLRGEEPPNAVISD
jgi:glyoxylate reductase